MDNDKYFDLLKGSGGVNSINQHDGFGDLLGECRVSSKEEVDEKGGKTKRLVITFTTDKEKNVTNNLIDNHYKNLSVSKFEDETVVDGDEKTIAELRSDLQHLIIQFPGFSVTGSGTDESKVEEDKMSVEELNKLSDEELIKRYIKIQKLGSAGIKKFGSPSDVWKIIHHRGLEDKHLALWYESKKVNELDVHKAMRKFEKPKPKLDVHKAMRKFKKDDKTKEVVGEESEALEDTDESKVNEGTTWEELGWGTGTLSPYLSGWKLRNPEGQEQSIVSTYEKSIKLEDGTVLHYLGDLAQRGFILIDPDGKEIPIDRRAEITDESKKVNELDEPDLERPEKARRKKPKRKKPVVDEPATDEVPEDEPVEEDPDEVPEIDKEPDPDEVPPPPEEIVEPEAPIEMRKEYLGRSEETHYYFITTEGAEGIIDDFVIADQEGIKKYSAKDNNIEVTEENIADFIIEAIRDINIAQVERGIFMKYIYPKLAEKAPEEEILEEPEGEEDEKRLLTPGEEEERPRESKKIANEDVSDWRKATSKPRIKSMISKLKGKTKKEEAKSTREDDLTDETNAWLRKATPKEIIDDLAGTSTEDLPRELETSHRLSDVGYDMDLAIATIAKEIERRKGLKDDEEEIDETKNLIEMKVVDGIGNEFDVNLADDGTTDTAISINGREFRFSSEFASMWRDESGSISEEGLEELALDALANMEEGEYQQIVARSEEDPAPQVYIDDVDGMEKSVPGETDWPLKDRSDPEPEEDDLQAPGIEDTTDDVDVSKGDVNRKPKYRPKEVEGASEEEEDEVSPYLLSGEELKRAEAAAKQGRKFPESKSVSEKVGENKEKEVKEYIGAPAFGEPFTGAGARKRDFPGKQVMADDITKAVNQMYYKLGYKPKPDDLELCLSSLSNPRFRQLGLAAAEGDEKGMRSYITDVELWRVGKKESEFEGKDQPGVRDGTGPAKDSAQRSVKGGVGKRKEAGEECPNENKENENIEGDNEMIDEKTVAGLLRDADKCEDEAKRHAEKIADLKQKAGNLRKEASGLEKEKKAEKDEGIDPKKEDSEEQKIKKLAEDEVKEDKIEETDVAKGAKALIQLAKDALKNGNYTEAADHCAKLADIEAVIPPEADAEAKKIDKAEPAKKDDDKPAKKDDTPVKKDDSDNADEKKKPPVCKKCNKAHWPFEKCDGSEGVKEAKDKDKAKKDKKDKKDKEGKEKKEKEAKAKKDKEAKAKAAKKESKIQVDSADDDITERKSIASLKNLLGMKD